jgi:hypothetical protein
VLGVGELRVLEDRSFQRGADDDGTSRHRHVGVVERLAGVDEAGEHAGGRVEDDGRCRRVVLHQLDEAVLEAFGDCADLRGQDLDAEVHDVEGQLFIGDRDRVVDVGVEGDVDLGLGERVGDDLPPGGGCDTGCAAQDTGAGRGRGRHADRERVAGSEGAVALGVGPDEPRQDDLPLEQSEGGRNDDAGPQECVRHGDLLKVERSACSATVTWGRAGDYLRGIAEASFAGRSLPAVRRVAAAAEVFPWLAGRWGRRALPAEHLEQLVGVGFQLFASGTGQPLRLRRCEALLDRDLEPEQLRRRGFCCRLVLVTLGFEPLLIGHL